MEKANEQEILVSLGKKIAALRNKNGLTQEKLAELTGRSTNHISKLESARCNPSFDLLVKISDVLNIELKELFTFSKKQPKTNAKEELKHILKTEKTEKIELLYKIYSALS